MNKIDKILSLLKKNTDKNTIDKFFNLNLEDTENLLNKLINQEKNIQIKEQLLKLKENKTQSTDKKLLLLSIGIILEEKQTIEPLPLI